MAMPVSGSSGNGTDDQQADNTDNQQADLMPGRYGPPLVTVKKRSDFLRLRGGARWSGPAFLIEARPPRPPKAASAHASAAEALARPEPGARFGFTITKKLGGAVVRNRIRRRLSHAIRAALQTVNAAPYDYVVVARPAAIDRPFTELVTDVSKALVHIAKAKPKPPRDTTAP